MPDVSTQSVETRVGLALSGGGFRAATFHLGVLKRLEELGVLQQVVAMSTVSGGSITGGLYALRCAERGGLPGNYAVDALIEEMEPFLTSNLRARALFGSPGRALRALWSLVSTRVSRIGLMVGDLACQLFRGATLDRLPPWVVINATNLRTGKAWKFFRDRAGDFLAGATDQTLKLKIAGAVAASAAYPGLTDSYAFVSRWEQLRGDLLSEDRWDRPRPTVAGSFSTWRERYAPVSGRAVFPLVDGGVYDNEGVNGLSGTRATHAIISGAARPESESSLGFTFRRYFRIVEVMHDRLGAATRQLAHEMTHGVHPSEARVIANGIAAALRRIASSDQVSDVARGELALLACQAEELSAVGVPPRGTQFRASAQVLLHQDKVARNAFSRLDGGLDIPPNCRGINPSLLAELSRVRTDLDALEPEVLELLIAQGYFVADAYVKLTMPDLLQPELLADGPYGPKILPSWARAHKAVADAHADSSGVSQRLRRAAHRHLIFGRVPELGERLRYCMNAVIGGVVALVVLAFAVEATIRALHALP